MYGFHNVSLYQQPKEWNNLPLSITLSLSTPLKTYSNKFNLFCSSFYHVHFCLDTLCLL